MKRHVPVWSGQSLRNVLSFWLRGEPLFGALSLPVLAASFLVHLDNSSGLRYIISTPVEGSLFSDPGPPVEERASSHFLRHRRQRLTTGNLNRFQVGQGLETLVHQRLIAQRPQLLRGL